MSLKPIEKIDDKVGNSIITVDGKHHYPILNEGTINKINELIEVVNEQSEKIVCLHCNKSGNGKWGEDHRCIWEVFDLFAEAIKEMKEDKCGNSGLNWNDYYENLKREIKKNYDL